MDMAKIRAEEWDSAPAFGDMLKATPDVQREIVRQASYLVSASNGDGTPPPLAEDSLYLPVLASVRAVSPIEAEWKQMGRDAAQRPDNLVRMLDALWRKPLVQAAKRLFKNKLPFSEMDVIFLAGRTAWLEANTSYENELLPEVVSTVEAFVAGAKTRGQLEEPIDALATAVSKAGGGRAKKIHWRLVEVQQRLRREPATPADVVRQKPDDETPTADALWAGFAKAPPDPWNARAFAKAPTVQSILAAHPDIRGEVAQLALKKLVGKDQHDSSAAELLRLILMKEPELPANVLARLAADCCRFQGIYHGIQVFMNRLVDQIESAMRATNSPELRTAVSNWVNADNFCGNKPDRDMAAQLRRMLEPKSQTPLAQGEAWSDAAIADLTAMKGTQHAKWLSLLAHCQTATGGAPSAKWAKTARGLLKEVGAEAFRRRVLAWFPLVNEPRTQRIEEWHREYHPDPNQLIIEPHADILKGLAWFAGLREDKELARALTALALSCYRKIPLKGPREVKVGNACVAALGLMPGLEGVYQLALLKVRVKFGTAQKGVEKALTAAAERAGLPRDELEEMAVPAYGLTEVGRSVETFGEFTAELRVAGTTSVELAWFKADGKPVKSVSAAVKQSHAEDLKELQTAAKDIARMLPAQRERLDSLFLQQREWPLAVWRERYLDHPLVGVLARRLIWEFTTAGKMTAGMWLGRSRREEVPSEMRNAERGVRNEGQSLVTSAPTGALVDLDLRPIAKLGEGTTVRLWHPIGKDVDEIVAWRTWLDEQQIQQPFKQAHREVYLLTDAERHTRTYSNRYAAHILKQHQFNALAALRGWKNKLRLNVDQVFPPATLHLPKWNLRAEFWIEGIGDDWGTDLNESGVYLRVATDQVRFYRPNDPQVTGGGFSGPYAPRHGEEAATPLALEEIPPLVFSEVMRDVDLFVGVASVGNDPAWNDGGPEGRHRDYWQSYSFGDLTATAQTRKAVLERLVPKLKIAGQCSFADKFVVVRGSLRTYKIHLGSGNILMSPNDQYLCIVPKQGVADDGKVFLPFEGDRTLSVILSKAFLLADDAKIKDPTIVSQIKKA